MKITHSIQEYIDKNETRKNVRWRIHGGKWFFELFPGFWQHEHSFDRFFPKYDFSRFNDKGSNPDKTKIV
jgi:hypothetical protein